MKVLFGTIVLGLVSSVAQANVVVNEFMINDGTNPANNGTSAGAGAQWIELYNTDNASVNLTAPLPVRPRCAGNGGFLVLAVTYQTTSTYHYPCLTGAIPGKGYYVIGNDAALAQGVPVDQIWNAFAFDVTGNGYGSDNFVNKIFVKTAAGGDDVSWNNQAPANSYPFVAGSSLARLDAMSSVTSASNWAASTTVLQGTKLKATPGACNSDVISTCLAPTKAPTKTPTKAPSKAPTSAPIVPPVQFTGLDLIHADTNAFITTLTNTTTVRRSDVSPRMSSSSPAFNIVATYNAATTNIASAVFWRNGTRFSTELTAPFAMCGNNGRDIWSCGKRLGCGHHVVTAVPYAAAGASGPAGTPLTVAFTIVC